MASMPSDKELKKLVQVVCGDGTKFKGPKALRLYMEKELGLAVNKLKPKHALIAAAQMDALTKPSKRKREGADAGSASKGKATKIKLSQPKKKKNKAKAGGATGVGASLAAPKKRTKSAAAAMSAGDAATADEISDSKLADAKAFIAELSNGSCSMDGWNADVQQRNGGVSAGSFDCYFIAPLGFVPVGATIRATKTKKVTRRRFRSRKDIARAFGLIVDTTERGGGRLAPSVAGAPLNAGSWRQVNNLKTRQSCHTDARKRLLRELGLIHEVRADPQEVLLWCRQTLDVLKRHKHAVSFLDKITDKIVPGYTKIIKKPMDLGTIGRKLETGKSYGVPAKAIAAAAAEAKGVAAGNTKTKKRDRFGNPAGFGTPSRSAGRPQSAEQLQKAEKEAQKLASVGKKVLKGFAKDVRLVFDNCMYYNIPDSEIHQNAAGLAKLFESIFIRCPLGTAPSVGASGGAAGASPTSSATSSASGSASGLPDRAACACVGRNRRFDASASACVCAPGHRFWDPRALAFAPRSADGVGACVPAPSAAPCAAEGAARNHRGECVARDFCPSCPRGGAIIPGVGLCHCYDTAELEEICDAECRARAQRQCVRAGSNALTLLDPTAAVPVVGELSSAELRAAGVVGEMSCSPNLGRECCEVTAVSLAADPSGGGGAAFAAHYGWAAVVAHVGATSVAPQRRRRRLNTVENPVVCIAAGNALLFDIQADRYPVYVPVHVPTIPLPHLMKTRFIPYRCSISRESFSHIMLFDSTRSSLLPLSSFIFDSHI